MCIARPDGRGVGAIGEQFAAEYITKVLGWQIIVQSWRCRRGELDIVAKAGATVVIIEVKARHSDRFGHPLEAVDARKQRQVAGLAGWCLADRSVFPKGHFGDVRFDVIGLCMSGEWVSEVWHIRDAFAGG